MVLTGPTAVGKGTVEAALRKQHPEVWVSVSATTRAPRPGEVDGVTYWFMGEDEFDKIQQYVEMCEKHKQEAVDAYLSLTCGDDLDGFEEAYQGEWDSEEDFAEHLVEECYFDDLNGLSDLIRNNIDWRGIAREIFMDGYEYEDGFVFYRR